MNPKPLTQSRTLWINTLVVVAAGLAGAMNTEVIAENPALLAYMVAGVGVVNIVLRLLTNSPIKI